MSDELGHLHGVFEALQLLGLLDPGLDMLFGIKKNINVPR